MTLQMLGPVMKSEISTLYYVSAIGVTTKISEGGGDPGVTIPHADAPVGDELWMYTFNGDFGKNEDTSGNWTEETSWSNGRWKLFSRIATGDANDNFDMDAGGRVIMAKSWSIGTNSLDNEFPHVPDGNGFNNIDLQNEWECGYPPGNPTSIAQRTVNDPEVWMMMIAGCSDINNDSPISPSVGNVPATAMLTTIIEEAHWFGSSGFTSGVDTVWMAVQFDYRAVGIAYSSYEISYGPVTSQSHHAQHKRYTSTPI